MSRRANGEGSIRHRADGRWEGRYTAGRTEDGKLISKSVTAKTQRECRDKLRKAIENSRGLVICKQSEYTVTEWMREWYEVYSKPHLRPGTADYYKNFIENHIIPNIGQIKLMKLTGTHIQNMYNKEKTEGRVKRFENQIETGLSNRTVRGIHMVLHQALERAVMLGIIPRNPCDNCIIPKKERKEMKTIPAEKVGAYLKAAESIGMLPLFYLELSSGLRRGEILALRWEDVDEIHSTIRVNKQVCRLKGELVVSQPKTPNSVRVVSVPKRAIDLLKQEREQHPDCQYVFMSPRTGQMLDPDSLGRIHKKVLKIAGLDSGIRFHDLRHTFATLALQNGVDAKTVSGMLGHTSSSFTLDVYTHLTRGMQEAAADKMEAFMDGAERFAPQLAQMA